MRGAALAASTSEPAISPARDRKSVEVAEDNEARFSERNMVISFAWGSVLPRKYAMRTGRGRKDSACLFRTKTPLSAADCVQSTVRIRIGSLFAGWYAQHIGTGLRTREETSP